MKPKRYHQRVRVRVLRRRSVCNQSGFSLVEMIGVMTVTAILASVILPSVIERIKFQAAEREGVFLERIDEALTAHLLKYKAFPDETGWAQAVASELGLPTSAVAETPQQSPRLYVIDPALRLGTAEGVLPFTQTAAGSIEPVSARIMVLTSMDGTNPIPLSSGVIAAADFDTLWDLPAGSIPPTWNALWQQSKDDLKVQRINLGPQFHKMLLNNYDSANPGNYSVDDGPAQLIPAEGISAFFVAGTVLGLHDGAAALETRQIIRRPCAFTYERDQWRGQVYQGLKLSGDDIYNATSLFARSSENPNAQNGATISIVIDAMTDYMNRYAEWDTANFPPNGSSSYEAAENAQSTLQTVTNQLIYAPLP